MAAIHACRTVHGIQLVPQETFFESLPARDGPSSAFFENGPSSAFFENPKNLASSSCGLRPGNTGNTEKHGEEARQEPESSTIPAPRFTRNHETWTLLYRTEGTYSRNCMMETPRYSLSELHFGKFPDSVDFQRWKVNFETEVCSNTPCHMFTMSSIKEVESNLNIDDLMPSQSIEGKDFPDFYMLDAKTAFALRKIISNSNFRRRVSVEEQRSSNTLQISARKTICLHDL